MIVAGIDFSTYQINVMMLGNATPRQLTLKVRAHGKAFDRARWVRQAMPLYMHWSDWGVAAFGIEHPAGRHGTGNLLRVQGAILACLPPEALVEMFTPSAWRKLCGLSGRSSKTEVAEFVRAREPAALHWEQDDCDAYCIALALQQVIRT